MLWSLCLIIARVGIANLRCSQCWLTSGMLHDDSTGWPALRLKAYNGRIFLLYVRTALQACSKCPEQQGNQELALACLAAQALCLFFSLSERAGRYLNAVQSRELHSAGTTFLRCYTALARMAALAGVRRWHLLPKMHASCCIEVWCVLLYVLVSRVRVCKLQKPRALTTSWPIS